jgi:hypothetical protein
MQKDESGKYSLIGAEFDAHPEYPALLDLKRIDGFMVRRTADRFFSSRGPEDSDGR